MLNIKPAKCGDSTGAITGITVTGTGKLLYTWRDENNNIIKHTLDLIGVPGGTYTLEVKDGSVCGKATLNNIIVDDYGISYADRNIVIQSSSCNSDGSIKGLLSFGANLFKWLNFQTGNSYTSNATADLVGVPAGAYKLTLVNTVTGCTRQTSTYFIPSQIQIPQVTKVQIINPTCGSKSDSIIVSIAKQKGGPDEDCFFADAIGNQVSVGKIFSENITQTLRVGDLVPGDYKLFIKGKGSCTAELGTYTIKKPVIEIFPDSSVIVNDRCNQHKGYIEPMFVGGTKPPPRSIFTWTDLNTGKVVGVFKTLFNAGAGTYRLEIDDPLGCIAFAVFHIANDSPEVVPPKSGDIVMCLPGITNLTATTKDTSGVFNLYSSSIDTIPIFKNKTGSFYINVKETSDYYISLKHGDCESTRTKVHVYVAASGLNIPNAFSPNNDNINDTWNIANIDKFPGAEIDVFTRQGQQVYHSINYSQPFTGQIHGKELLSGVYYYVIDLKIPICFGKISGSLTILR